MDATVIANNSNSVSPVKWLTWRRCSWIITAMYALGIILGLWWPLWLMPPRLSDSVIIYIALSQVWVIVLAVCTGLHPAAAGQQRMLKVFAVAWPLTALLMMLLLGAIWSKGMNATPLTVGNSTSLWFYLLVWLILVILPIAMLRRRFQPSVDERPKLGKLPLYLAAGMLITIVYAFSVIGDAALVDGGILTEPLRCDPPVIAQGQISYTCHQTGISDYRVDYVLSGAEGSPVGQLHYVGVASQ